MKERFLEILCANVTSCPNEIIGSVRKVLDTEALVLSVDRVLNFSSVENSLFQDGLLEVKI